MIAPLSRLHLPGEDLQQRRLAGAVLADERVHLARAHVQVRAAEGVDAAVALVHAVGAEDLGC